jgi:hydrogenase maturation protease
MMQATDQNPTSDIQHPKSRRVLVVGFGNVLNGDDGFGVAVLQRLARHPDLPPGVTLLEVGIGGMSLIHVLQDGYDALLLVDAVDRGGAPGTTYLLEPDVPDLATLPFEQRQDFLADMHLATPARALLLARALDVLPRTVYMLGCQPAVYEDLALGLSAPVAQAVEAGVERLITELRRLTAAPCAGGSG